MSTRSTAVLTRGWMSCCVKPMIRRLPILMTDVDRLLRDYIDRFESGDSVDPRDLLDELDGAERRKLSTLIEGYLEHAARPREWDPEAFEGSVADRAVSRVAAGWAEEASEQTSELVRLRNERLV